MELIRCSPLLSYHEFQLSCVFIYGGSLVYIPPFNLCKHYLIVGLMDLDGLCKLNQH